MTMLNFFNYPIPLCYLIKNTGRLITVHRHKTTGSKRCHRMPQPLPLYVSLQSVHSFHPSSCPSESRSAAPDGTYSQDPSSLGFLTSSFQYNPDPVSA